MTGLKTLLAAALLSTISATAVLAQQESARLAQFPDRDWLNGGVATPAVRGGLQPAYGAAGNAHAGTDTAPALRPRRHR